MSIRKISFIEGEYYHIYNRGNSKQKIFHDYKDYNYFMGLLYACNSVNNYRLYGLGKNDLPYDFERGQVIVNIGAYVLMPNHFHILITPVNLDGISKFIQKVSTAYAMYYNKKYNRVGGLFEGKFKSEHVNEDKYLKYLFSYIHLNPIKLIQKDWKEVGLRNKKEALEYLNSYQYSSFIDWIGKERIQNSILDTVAFPKYFPSEKSFWSEILEWLEYHKND